MATDIPKRIPEKGFYYHYKHDPNKSVNNYAYEVLGVSINSEDESLCVVYQPLYKEAFKIEFEGLADYYARPFDMFLGVVEIESVLVDRFTKIVDAEVVSELLEIKKALGLK